MGHRPGAVGAEVARPRGGPPAPAAAHRGGAADAHGPARRRRLAFPREAALPLHRLGPREERAAEGGLRGGAARGAVPLPPHHRAHADRARAHQRHRDPGPGRRLRLPRHRGELPGEPADQRAEAVPARRRDRGGRAHGRGAGGHDAGHDAGGLRGEPHPDRELDGLQEHDPQLLGEPQPAGGVRGGHRLRRRHHPRPGHRSGRAQGAPRGARRAAADGAGDGAGQLDDQPESVLLGERGEAGQAEGALRGDAAVRAGSGASGRVDARRRPRGDLPRWRAGASAGGRNPRTVGRNGRNRRRSAGAVEVDCGPAEKEHASAAEGDLTSNVAEIEKQAAASRRPEDGATVL